MNTMDSLSLFLDLILIAGLLTVGTLFYKVMKHICICLFWASHDTTYTLLNLRKGLTFWQIVKGLTKVYLVTFYKTHDLRMRGAERTS